MLRWNTGRQSGTADGDILGDILFIIEWAICGNI